MALLLDAIPPTASMSAELVTLLEAALALALVALAAWLFLRWLGRLGVGKPRGRLLQTEDRIALDGRNALWIVRADERRFLLATHPEGPARLIAELPHAVPSDETLVRAPRGKGDTV